jgi:hypothetical protein
VEDDAHALAVIRYLERNPVRAGLGANSAAYPWSTCTAYTLGTPNSMITRHPSYLALSPYAEIRQRHYRTLLVPRGDTVADGRDPRWTTQRALGRPASVTRYAPRRPGRPRLARTPSQNQGVAP